MKKINWCKKQANGIKIKEPNENLSQEYFKNAEESIRVLRSIKETNQICGLQPQNIILNISQFILF